MRRFVRAVIHNATVTLADNAWPVSLRLDPVLMEAMQLRAYEEVELINITTGARFTTWVESGDGGEVRVHAGAAFHVRQADIVSVVSAGWLHDGQTLNHKARIVTLDAKNAIVSISES